MNKEDLNKRVSSIEECIIETPLAEVFVDDKSIGLHNEYTVRRIVLAVQREELNNNFTFVFKGKEHKIIKDDKKSFSYVSPSFPSGFYDVSYNLAFELMN